MSSLHVRITAKTANIIYKWYGHFTYFFSEGVVLGLLTFVCELIWVETDENGRKSKSFKNVMILDLGRERFVKMEDEKVKNCLHLFMKHDQA